MKRKIFKSIEEEIDIDISSPKYVKFYDSVFFRFTETDGVLQVVRVSNHSGLDIQVRNDLYESDRTALFMEDSNYKEITADEFNTALLDSLERFGLLQKELI